MKIFLKATVMAEAMIVKAWMRLLQVIGSLLGQRGHGKSMLKAVLMIHGVKNEL